MNSVNTEISQNRMQMSIMSSMATIFRYKCYDELSHDSIFNISDNMYDIFDSYRNIINA